MNSIGLLFIRYFCTVPTGVFRSCGESRDGVYAWVKVWGEMGLRKGVYWLIKVNDGLGLI